jgi:hypothetical protein
MESQIQMDSPRGWKKGWSSERRMGKSDPDGAIVVESDGKDEGSDDGNDVMGIGATGGVVGRPRPTGASVPTPLLLPREGMSLGIIDGLDEGIVLGAPEGKPDPEGAIPELMDGTKVTLFEGADEVRDGVSARVG